MEIDKLILSRLTEIEHLADQAACAMSTAASGANVCQVGSDVMQSARTVIDRARDVVALAKAMQRPGNA